MLTVLCNLSNSVLTVKHRMITGVWVVSPVIAQPTGSCALLTLLGVKTAYHTACILLAREMIKIQSMLSAECVSLLQKIVSRTIISRRLFSCGVQWYHQRPRCLLSFHSAFHQLPVVLRLALHGGKVAAEVPSITSRYTLICIVPNVHSSGNCWGN